MRLAKKVKTNGWDLIVFFGDGSVKKIDIREYLKDVNTPSANRVKTDIKFFEKVVVEDEVSLTWPTGYCIDPDYIYEEGVNETQNTTFLEKLGKVLNAKFISASPLRVDFFVHDLSTKSNSNIEATKTLANEPHTTLHSFPEGDLNLYHGGIVLVTKDQKFPIKFYCAWKTSLFLGTSAIQTKQIWCDKAFRKLRIEGLPLGAYCLFKILLPKYKIVIGADEHTPDGERHAKSQVKYALANGVYVYVVDENKDIYNINKSETIENNENVFWGIDPEHKKRLLVYSQKNMFP
jgi:hypothetical protein